MFRKITLFVVTGLFAVNLCGCLLLAGAAGGGGTAVWLGDKATQNVNVSYADAVSAARKGLTSLDIEITKETKADDVTQFLGKYSDGKQIWVDVRPVTKASSKVDVRVGRLSPDKAAAEKIMKQIMRYM